MKKQTITTTEPTPLMKAESALANVQAIKIDSQESFIQAAELLVQIKELINWGEAEKSKKTAPLHKAWKDELAHWKPYEDISKKAEKMIKDKIEAHNEAVRLKAIEAEAALQKKIDTGYISKPETITARQQQIEQPQRAVFTGLGSVIEKDVKEVVIVDVSLIPREYMVVDMARLRKAALEADKAGMSIAGVRVDNKKQIAVKA
jgi:hypothetical protein